MSWADDHGYQIVRCHTCGFRGWSDTGIPDCECETSNEGGEDDSRTTGDRITTLHTATKHVARKIHLQGTPQEIRPGDVYTRTVMAGYRVEEGRWLSVDKHRESKGSAWGE